METVEIRQKDMIHYHKINIFGESDVGKTSLISLLEHYNDENFKIEVDTNRNSSFNEQSSIVEQIKKLDIKLYEDRTLYLNIYETNLNRFDPIKINLDTLLVQTECIIIMFDNSSKNYKRPLMIDYFYSEHKKFCYGFDKLRGKNKYKKPYFIVHKY